MRCDLLQCNLLGATVNALRRDGALQRIASGESIRPANDLVKVPSRSDCDVTEIVKLICYQRDICAWTQTRASTECLEKDQTTAVVVSRLGFRCKLGFVIRYNVIVLSIYTMGQEGSKTRGKSGKFGNEQLAGPLVSRVP